MASNDNLDNDSTTLPSKFTFDSQLPCASTSADSSQKTKKPKLIVFDLDYTLWPFWVDTHVTPPFRKDKGVIYDRTNQKVSCYKDVPQILEKLSSEGYVLGIASRTTCILEARQLIKLFEWEKYFTYSEIYPGAKINHFKKFRERSKISYKNMLFFDDEMRNVRDVSNIGVTCVLVRDGMTFKVLQEGLEAFKQS